MQAKESKFEQWVTTVNGGVAPTVGALAAIRRLHFEAEIVLTSTLKASVEQTQESTTPRPLPQAERTARMRQLKQQFTGLLIEGANEPQALVDECCHQNETKVLRYIEPAKCNSREPEVAIGRTDRKLRIESNTLSVKEAKTTPDEDVSTSFKLQQCLRRRAIAYEFSSLISEAVHEKYIDKLMRRLHTKPPPNYQATSMRADREVWVHMSQNVDDIKQQPDGSRPLDKAIMEAQADTVLPFIFSLYLCQLQVPMHLCAIETQYKRKEATKANQVLLDAKTRAAIASQSFLGNELPVMLQKLSYCHNAEAGPVGRRSL